MYTINVNCIVPSNRRFREIAFGDVTIAVDFKEKNISAKVKPGFGFPEDFSDGEVLEILMAGVRSKNNVEPGYHKLHNTWVFPKIIQFDENVLQVESSIHGYDSNGEGIFTLNHQGESEFTVIKEPCNCGI